MSHVYEKTHKSTKQIKHTSATTPSTIAVDEQHWLASCCLQHILWVFATNDGLLLSCWLLQNAWRHLDQILLLMSSLYGYRCEAATVLEPWSLQLKYLIWDLVFANLSLLVRPSSTSWYTVATQPLFPWNLPCDPCGLLLWRNRGIESHWGSCQAQVQGALGKVIVTDRHKIALIHKWVCWCVPYLLWSRKRYNKCLKSQHAWIFKHFAHSASLGGSLALNNDMN